MNVRTALILSALLIAVLGWACEQQGPASPSALGTPGGSSLGGVSLDAASGVRLAVDCDKKPDNPNCNGGGGGDDDLQRFDITIAGPHISSATPQTTNGPKGGLLVKGFTLDLKDFFEFKLTCGGDTPNITGPQTGNVSFLEGSAGSSGHAEFHFGFTHEGIRQGLSLKGIITDPGNWPPATGTSNSMTEDPGGPWKVTASGRNHQAGCTGEGVGITWTALIDPV